MTRQSEVIFLKKNEISIYTLKCSGIMENWIKHELLHLKNEISWWHDMTHDNMSSHDIRHMTSCMCPTTMIFCFVRFSGQRIHSDYCHLRDHHECPWNVRSRHGLRALTTWQNKKSRRQWRDLRFSRSSVKITQLAIVRMNFLNQKPYETKKNHLGRTNTSRNNKSHVNRDVTFNFKVTRDGHANGDSWNEFRDLKTSRNNIKIIAVG